MPLALLFDCDGTLVNTEPLHEQATIAAYRDMGVDEGYFHGFAGRFMGYTTEYIHRIVQAETGITATREQVIGRIHHHSTRILETAVIDTMPGCPEALAMLAAHHAMAVVSNGNRAVVLASLENTGLDQYFPEHHIFTKCQVPHPKPAPDAYLLAASTLGITPHDCLVIEDSLAGVKAGVAAGMRVLGYYGSSLLPDAASSLREAGAERTFSDYRELPGIVTGAGAA
jgi:HAD superfamily hydrolase (TIGR01509 family)